MAFDYHPQLTQALCTAWKTTTPMPSAQAHPPDSDEAAYHVQRQVADHLGWFTDNRPRAWKVGGSMAHPTAAPIADAHLASSPFHLKSTSAHTMIGIEAELAVRLGAPLEAGADTQHIRAAIDRVVPAIEICDVRALGWPALSAPFLLADQQMNRCLILGRDGADTWHPALTETSASLMIHHDVIRQGAGCHPLGDPLALIPWLAQHAATFYPPGLAAGDWITTGTWLGLYEARQGDSVCVRFSGLGDVHCHID